MEPRTEYAEPFFKYLNLKQKDTLKRACLLRGVDLVTLKSIIISNDDINPNFVQMTDKLGNLLVSL